MTSLVWRHQLVNFSRSYIVYLKLPKIFTKLRPISREILPLCVVIETYFLLSNCLSDTISQ